MRGGILIDDNSAMLRDSSSPGSTAAVAADALLLREDVGRRLRRARRESGLTLADLARRSGVPLSTVSKIELGRHAASHEKLVALARALGHGPQLLWPVTERTGPGVAVPAGAEAGGAPPDPSAQGEATVAGAAAPEDPAAPEADAAGAVHAPMRLPQASPGRLRPAGPRALRCRLEDAPRRPDSPMAPLPDPGVSLSAVAADGRRTPPDDTAAAAAGLWRDLSAGFGAPVMRPFHQVVLAREPSSAHPLASASGTGAAVWQRHGGQCLVHVLGGAVLLRLDDGASWPLTQGQSAYLDAGVGHRCTSTSARPAELLWVLGPPA